MRPNKGYILLCAILVWLVAAVSPVQGMDGQALFQKKCGACHNTFKTAPPIGPVKYAAIQWERFFFRKKHQRKKDINQLITQEEILIIKKFLKDHAADSDRPIAAGIK